MRHPCGMRQMQRLECGTFVAFYLLWHELSRVRQSGDLRRGSYCLAGIRGFTMPASHLPGSSGNSALLIVVLDGSGGLLRGRCQPLCILLDWRGIQADEGYFHLVQTTVAGECDLDWSLTLLPQAIHFALESWR